MSRENFFIKAKGLEGAEEYFHITNITRLVEVAEDKTKKLPAHTQVYLVGQTNPVLITEKVEELERRGGSMAVLRVVK